MLSLDDGIASATCLPFLLRIASSTWGVASLYADTRARCTTPTQRRLHRWIHAATHIGLSWTANEADSVPQPLFTTEPQLLLTPNRTLAALSLWRAYRVTLHPLVLYSASKRVCATVCAENAVQRHQRSIAPLALRRRPSSRPIVDAPIAGQRYPAYVPCTMTSDTRTQSDTVGPSREFCSSSPHPTLPSTPSMVTS
jgi:hypothetical protein